MADENKQNSIKNEKQQDKILKDSTLQDYIESDQFGMTLNKFRKQNKKLDDLTDQIRKFTINQQKTDNTVANSLDRMFDLAKNSFKNTSLTSNNLEIYDKFKTSSGIRALSDMGINPEELKVVDMFEQNIRNCFVQMNEFRIICKIVPELKKVVKNVVRDILNTNDTHKRFITNIFKTNTKIAEKNKENIATINSEIDTKVILRNDLETKIKKYIEEALITGAKPVAVIQYSDIYEMIQNDLLNRNAGSNNKSYSTEAFYEYCNNIESHENYFLPNIRENFIKRYSYSLESSQKIENKTIYDDILQNSVEKYYNYEKEKLIYKINRGIEILSRSAEENQNKIDELTELKNQFNDDNNDTVKAQKSNIKSALLNLVNIIDSNIDIVNPNQAAFNMAKKALKAGWNVKKLYENEDHIEINSDYSRRSDAHIMDQIKQSSKAVNQELNNKTVFDRKERSDKDNTRSFKIDQKQFEEELNDVLILDFDPENVIPIIINGVHVDYYIMENEVYDGGMERNKKVGFTFMDIVASLGVANDNTVMGNGIQTQSLDMIGLGSIPSFGQQINVNTLSSSITMNVQTDDALKRNEILRDIVLRTISVRMNNIDLIDNKIFRDSIMNLLRQGYILKKKVQFTNIPASNMVYFAHDLSDQGLPNSIYADTLFYCYLYISSLVSTLMIKLAKSSNKDKIEFDIAQDQNFALASQLIDHGLSTRQTHGFNTFDSIFSVLKNSVAHDRIIVPLINGDPLVKYEEMNKMNDISIDDEFTENLLDKIISSTGLPSSILNKLSEDEYARSISSQNLNYVHDLIDKQETFAKQILKLLKLCLKYTKFSKGTEEYIKENINSLEYKLEIPKQLFITNENESFGHIKDYAETISEIYFGDKLDSEEYKPAISSFKAEVIKYNSSNIDWSIYEEIYEKAMSSSQKERLKTYKKQKINELTEEANPIDLTQNDDLGGGDMGGDFGGDTGSDDMSGGAEETGDEFGSSNDESFQF